MWRNPPNNGMRLKRKAITIFNNMRINNQMGIPNVVDK